MLIDENYHGEIDWSYDDTSPGYESVSVDEDGTRVGLCHSNLKLWFTSRMNKESDGYVPIPETETEPGESKPKSGAGNLGSVL